MNDTPSDTPAPILVDSKQAAVMLSIGTRKLWELTSCRAIPSVRIDRLVRYRIADLEAWSLAGCPTRAGMGR